MRSAACFGWLLFLVLFPAIAPPGLAQEFQVSAGEDNCADLPGSNIPSCLGGTFTDTGTTLGANSTVDQVNAGCLPNPFVLGSDLVYRFEILVALQNPTLDIRVTPAPTYDVAIYLLGPGAAACPAGPNAFVNTCVFGADAGGPGVTEIIPHSALVALPVGSPYFLFIDSSAQGPASAGSYTLSVGPGVCPVELLDFAVE